VEVPITLAEFCRPDRMALIVYDMQVGIVRQISDGVAVTEQTARVLACARRNGVRVVFTRHMSLPTKLMGRFQVRQAMAWQHLSDPDKVQPWFLRDSPGFQIVPELEPREDEAILDKITFSAFEGTPLAMILRDCGLMAFAIVGIAIEIGIDPTARHGADLGLVPIVVQDACGTGEPEAARRSLANLASMGDAIMTDSAGFSATLLAAVTHPKAVTAEMDSGSQWRGPAPS
jgi:nicotinamidase-related amidase